MKLSKFIVYFPLTKREYLVYQTASQAILVLSDDILLKLLNGKIDDLSEDCLTALKENSFILDDDVDELSIYEYLMYLGEKD